MNELMEAALAYAADGWPVIPLHSRAANGGCTCGKLACDSPAKHPRFELGLIEHGLSEGTKDESLIRRWWMKWPNANIGILTGAVSGRVGVDLDGPNATGLLKQEGVFLPKSDTVQTGKGYHAIFGYPGFEIKNGTKILTDGNESNESAIDFRGDGGYLCAPPSVHISGRVYQWTVKVDKLPVLPNEFLRLLEREQRRADESVGNDPGWVDEVLKGVSKGQRNDIAARLTGYWLKVTDGNEGATQKAMALWNRLCKPPLSDRELETTIESISRRNRLQKQYETQTGKNYTRLEVLDGLAWAEAVKESPPREGITAPIDTLDEVGGLVAGDLITLAGGPGMGKSTRAWNVLAEICIRQKVPTVVFSTEMTRYDVARWVASYLEGTSVNELPRRLPEHILKQFRDSPIKLIDAGATTLEDIETIVSGSLGVRLVIVDHLTRVSTKRRENRNLEVGQIARGLKSIAKDNHCTVLALCQINRAGNDNNRPKLSALRESGEIEQESDAVIFQWTNEEDLTQRYLKLAVYLAKNRHGAVKQRTVTWDRLLKRFAVPTNENVSGDETQEEWENIQDGPN